MKIGYKLATEAFGPKEIVRQTRLAEEAGFDFVEMSDHFHPWLDAQGHSAFTWSMLGTMAAVTDRIGLATGVTCPSFRYHPAIIAQAAATVAILSDGRFTLGVGAGEDRRRAGRRAVRHRGGFRAGAGVHGRRRRRSAVRRGAAGLMHADPDADGFLEFFSRDLGPALRSA